MNLKYLILSFGLHAALFWSFDQLSILRKEEPVQLPIEVVVKTTSNPQSRNDAGGNQALGRKSKKLDFGISSMKSVLQSSGFGSSNHSIPNDWNRTESFTPNALNQFEGYSAQDVVFLKSLWVQIDKSIENSPYLSEYGHFGKVFLTFEIESEGRLSESTLKAKAEDNVLKVIAARAVRKALRDETAELSKPTHSMKINTQFSWSNYQNCSQNRGIQKNNLSFCTYAEDKRKTFSAGEKTQAYLKALQAGPDAFDVIKQYKREEMHRDTHFDPFESYSRDPDWNLGG